MSRDNNFRELSAMASKMFFEEEAKKPKPSTRAIAASKLADEESQKEDLGEHRIFTKH